MPRLLPAPALLLALLAIACSGDDDDGATPTAAAETSEITPTEPPAATATAEPPEQLVSPGPVEPLTYTPYAPSDGLTLEELVIYDVELQSEVLRESETYFDVWLRERSVPWAIGEDESLVMFDESSETWQELDSSGRPEGRVASHDEKLAAVVVGGRLHLLNFDTGTRLLLGEGLDPWSFSPDGSKLLVQTVTPSAPPGQVTRYVVIPTNQPQAAFELPPGSLPNSVGQSWPRWLDDRRLLLFDSSPSALQVQVFDVSGTTADTVLEAPVASQIAAVSRDGSMIAVEGRDRDSQAVEIYRLDSFDQVTTIEGATLGQSADVPAGVWSSDNSKLLVSYDVCGEDERLVAHDVASGAETELARGQIIRWVFSPDDAWVAYTAWRDEAFVVPADGSSQAVPAGSGVQATFSPRWSDDSRYAVFNRTVGGYDRCIP